MTSISATPSRSSPPGPEVSRAAAPWVVRLAHLGYAAKGAVYVVVGGLALHAAFAPVAPRDSKGALIAVLHQPLGRVLLAVLAVGLASYVLWRLVQVVLDPEDKGTDARGIALRAGYLLSAGVYGLLALEAVRMVTGTATLESGDQRTDHWTALLMNQPMGRWAAGLVGAGIIGFGLLEMYRGLRVDLRKDLDLTALGGSRRPAVVRFGRVGLMARGVVFLIIGWLLIRAAREYEPAVATDVGGALRVLQSQSHGRWMLGVVAVGLIAYGAFQLVKGRYRTVRVR